uniref:Uncharacterized protein n=1 Tax=Anguilla anguilla TaxID=7936 RepID=A0A0E9XGW1_ANGAN
MYTKKKNKKTEKVCMDHPISACGGWALVAVVILLVLLALALAAVHAVAVLPPPFAVVAHVEARVHLGQRVHAQDLVDLAERKQPEGELSTGCDVFSLLLSHGTQGVC